MAVHPSGTNIPRKQRGGRVLRRMPTAASRRRRVGGWVGGEGRGRLKDEENGFGSRSRSRSRSRRCWRSKRSRSRWKQAAAEGCIG